MGTTEVAEAFARGVNKASGNHMATHDGSRSSYYLHGTAIAVLDRDAGTLWLGHGGYPSVTTAKALRAVLAAMPWLGGASLSSWILLDASDIKAPVGRDGVTLYRREDLRGYWRLDAPSASLAPTLGGKV